MSCSDWAGGQLLLGLLAGLSSSCGAGDLPVKCCDVLLRVTLLLLFALQIHCGRLQNRAEERVGLSPHCVFPTQ